MKRYIHFRFSKILNFEKMEKMEKHIKASKPAQQSQKVSKSISQQSQQGRKPASRQATDPSVRVSRAETRLTVYRSAYNKDAVSASCILPGRAPIRTISQKNDAVEIFYLKSRL